MKSYIKTRLQLFRMPAYTCYFLAAVLATLATGMIYICNAWLVVTLDHDLNIVIYTFLAFWIPNALVSPIAGSLVDRYDRKRTVVVGMVLYTAIYAGFGLSLKVFPKPDIIWLFIVYMLMGLLNAFFMPALMAFIREIIPKNNLLYANANLAFGYQTGRIVGVGIAGYMIHLLQFSGAYLVCAGLFAIAGVLIASIHQRYRNIAKLTAVQHKKLKQMFVDTQSGWRYIASNKPRKIMYLTELFVTLILLTTPVLLAPFAKSILHAKAVDLSHIEMMMTIGTVIGGIFLIYLAEKSSFSVVLFFSIFLMTSSIVVFSTINSINMAMLCYFFIGFSLGSWSILVARTQQITDPAYQGRVQSLLGSVTACVIVVFYFLMGMATHHISIRHVYWVVAVLSIVPLVIIISYSRYFNAEKRK